jgi:hypothetical protein
VKVAEVVHAVGGTVCDWDQLAAQMKQAAGGGEFRMRVMTARSFGLLTYDRGTVTLTDLGLRVVDPKRRTRMCSPRAQSDAASRLHMPQFLGEQCCRLRRRRASDMRHLVASSGAL